MGEGHKGSHLFVTHVSILGASCFIQVASLTQSIPSGLVSHHESEPGVSTGVHRDRVGECHEMWGIQRDGLLCRDRNQAVVVEAEAHLLSQQAKWSQVVQM